jgi:putative ABC transport system permease protein
LEFAADGRATAPGHEAPRAQMRIISPAFFATLGLPMSQGRDLNDADRQGSELVAVVSQSLAQRMFPNGDAVNHHVTWTDPILKAVPMLNPEPMRIVGIVPDIDDEHIVPRPIMTVY